MLKKLSVILLILVACLGIVSLSACSNVEVESISIDPSSKYTTQYNIGDDIDLNGIKLIVKTTDGEESVVTLTDVRQDIVVMNFNSSKPKESLSIVVEYKGKQTFFTVSISEATSTSIRHTVSFYVEGENLETIPDQEVANYSSASQPKDPIRTGYIFDGWYTERTYNNPWNFNVDKVSSNVVLYAKWAVAYTVTFIPTDSEDLTPIIRFVKAGDALSNIPSVPEVEGKVGKWDKSVFVNIQSNIETRSVYNVKKFKVTFCYMDADGVKLQVLRTFDDVPFGTNMETDPEYQDSVESIVPPTYIGDTRYSGRWNTSYARVTSDLTVQAVYVSKIYTARFSMNYGITPLIHAQYEDITHGNAIEPPVAPTREGYAFDGWYKDSDSNVPWNFSLMTIGDDITLYAKWVKEHQVYFLISSEYFNYFENITEVKTYIESGENVDYKVHSKFSVRASSKIERPDPPRMQGYSSSWDKDEAAFDPVLSDLKVIALFTIEKYKVDFCKEDGSIIVTQNVEFEGSATPPSTPPEKYGYSFAGWREDFSSIKGDLKVHPIYEAKDVNVNIYPRNNYVNPETNGNYYSRTSKFDDLIVLLDPSPSYVGHQFEGWYSDEPRTIPWVLGSTLIKVEEGVSLYANWLVKYEVRFENESEVPVSGGVFEVVEGTRFLATMPLVPEKEGYSAVWYVCEGNVFVQPAESYWNTTIRKNIIVRPKYDIKTYKVSYVLDSKETITREVEHGAARTQPDQIGVESYLDSVGQIFIRWEPDIPLDQPVVGDITINAVSSLKTFKVTWRDSNYQELHVEPDVPYGSNAEIVFNGLGIARPEREGYSFTGWTVQSPVGANIKEISTDVVIDPVYQLKSYIVNISNLYDGSEKLENSAEVSFYNDFIAFGNGEKVELPQRTGYSFVGWESSRFKIGRIVDAAGVEYWVLTNTNTAHTGIHYFEGRLILYRGDVYRETPPAEPHLGNEGWQNTCGKLIADEAGGWIDVATNSTFLNVGSIAFPGRLVHVYGEDSDYAAVYQINSFTVTFDVVVNPNNVGNVPSNFVGNYGAKPAIPTAPTLTGYVFLGWYTDDNYIERWDKQGGLAYQNLESDYTVYARWEIATVNPTQGISYALNDSQNGYIVTGMQDVDLSSGLTHVIIPNYYNNLPVIGIGFRAIYSNPILAQSLESIDLPSTLYHLSNNAFENCVALKSIEIPSFVTEIPNNVFNGCVSLNSVTFKQGSTISTIGAFAFANNVSLKEFILPSGLISIENNAFYQCSSLVSINIPATVMSIGDRAFSNCTSLTHVTFHSLSPINLGERVFDSPSNSYNSFKAYVVDPTKYATGSSWANENWQTLYEKGKIINKENISLDGNWSFSFDGTRVKLLQYLGEDIDVEIPSSILTSYSMDEFVVSSLANYIFNYKILDVKFESSIEFDRDAFSSCYQLNNITLDIVNNSVPITNFDLTYVYANGGSSLTKFSVSSSKKMIEIFGGYPPSKIKEVVVIDKDDYIVANMFENCAYIEIIRFDTKIQQIRENAFYGCVSLREVYIATNPSSSDNELKSIGREAFSGSYSLETFYVTSEEEPEIMVAGLPNTITTIGEDAFKNTAWLAQRPGGLVVIGDGILYTYKNSLSLSPVVILPKEIKRISSNAFYGNSYITHIIPEEDSQLKEIGANAFRYCSSLEAVVVPNGFISFGNNAFESATKLDTLVVLGTTTVPLLGDSFIANTLKHPSTGNNALEIYVDNTLTPSQKQTYVNLSTSLSYSVNYEDNLFLSYSIDEEDKWVLADASSGTGLKAIKFFGNSIICNIPSTILGDPITEIENNAFTRSIVELGLNLSMTAKVNAFAGLTRVERLEITAPNFASVKMNGDILYQLMTANSGLSTLATASVYSLKALLNNKILPQNISKVQILAGQEIIESSFLENCVYVNEITILSEVSNETIETPLETYLSEQEISEKNIAINSVKDRAFSGTGWIQGIENDFISVLNGVLVDYKGINNVLEIPNTIKTIGYGVFNGNQEISVIYIPKQVENIEEYAFADMPNLTKIFLQHDDQIPTIKQNSFNVGSGREIFVKENKLLEYQAEMVWAGFYPAVEPDTPIITEEISRVFVRESSGNLLLEVRTISYLIDKQGGDGSNSRLHWIRDVYITYDIPNATPSYEKDYIDVSLYTPISVVESATVSIPEEIVLNGITLTIKSLGNNVFMAGVKTISINLDDEVTSYAFANLKTVTELRVLKSDSIENRQISGKALTEIITTNSLRKISYFGGVKLDDLLQIVTEGPPEALNLRPSSLKSVSILDGAVETVNEMLNGWNQITEIIFPSSIVKVGINSIDNTIWYQQYYDAKYGSDFIVLADKVLYKYRGTSSTVTVPANVQIINTGAFSTAARSGGSDWTWSSSLSFTTLRFAQGSKLHTIEEHAFHGCVGLSNFNAPDLLRNISASAFTNTQFTYTAEGFLIIDGTYVQGKTIVKYLGDSNVISLTLPADVKTIAASAFEGLTLLETISWGEANSILSNIGDRAFYGCTNLATVPLSADEPHTPKISSVGRDAFKNTSFDQFANQFMRDDGRFVVYKRVGVGNFEIDETVFSVTPGAISGASKIVLRTGAGIPESDMYSLLSTSGVTGFESDGSTPIKILIGSSNILLNIENLFFLESTQNIVSEYVKGWISISDITWPKNLKSVGRDAFTGTKWLMAVQNDYVTPGGANTSGVLIKYKGVSPIVHIDHRIISISTDAFRNNADITEIQFDEMSQITEIPPSAFSGCINLENIKGIPSTVVSIGQDAFKDTLWLSNHNDLVVINGMLIAYRGTSESIYIPKEVQTIYPYAFSGNNTITSVEFDRYSKIKSIDANTFANCTLLASVKLSESIDYIDSQAFINTPWINLIQVSSNGGFIVYEDTYTKQYKLIKYVGTKTIVSIPIQTTEIGSWTFRDNKTITKVTIDKGVYLPDYTFSGCTSLSQIELHNLVTIGENAFLMTPWIIAKTEKFVLAGNGYLIKYNGADEEVTLPPEVKGITGNVFKNNTSITSINLSATQISTIPSTCFEGATNLSSIEFTPTITSFGKDAFNGTQWLNNHPDDYVVINGVLVAYKGSSLTVSIPSSVSYIPRYVFEKNMEIETLEFDANYIALEDYAFYGCTALENVINTGLISRLGANTFRQTPYYFNLAAANEDYPTINGILLGFTGQGDEIIIPAGVREIAPYAFYGENLTKVTFELITTEISIGEKAFAENPDLDTVLLSSNVKVVGGRAFYNTYWLDNLDSPYVIVDGKLLMYAGKSSAIEIPVNVNSMAYGVFTNNKSITTVRFNTTSQNEFFLPADSFNGCTNLNLVNLPTNTNIGENAFKGTPWLTGKGKFAYYNNKLFAYNGQEMIITALPSVLVAVYPYVFKGNVNLKSISFAGTQVKSIANGEFEGCTSLETVILNNSLLELSTSAFNGTPWLRDYSQNNNEAKFIIVNTTKLMAYISNDAEVVIPSQINYIGTGAFTGNTFITSVDFESVENMLQIPNNAFKGCTLLETVKLTGYIEELGIDAFAETPWYSSLDDGAFIIADRILLFKGVAAGNTYTVPENIKHIGTNAFLGAAITTLVMENATPCTLGRGDVLQGVETIYVPNVDAQTAYRNNTAWGSYRDKIQIKPAG